MDCIRRVTRVRSKFVFVKVALLLLEWNVRLTGIVYAPHVILVTGWLMSDLPKQHTGFWGKKRSFQGVLSNC